MWGNDEVEICEVFASETYGGGILTAWDPGIFEVDRKFVGDRWVLLVGRVLKLSFECCIGVVY